MRLQVGRKSAIRLWDKPRSKAKGLIHIRLKAENFIVAEWLTSNQTLGTFVVQEALDDILTPIFHGSSVWWPRLRRIDG